MESFRFLSYTEMIPTANTERTVHIEYLDGVVPLEYPEIYSS